MAVGFPAKTNFATGDVLTATNMNDVTGTLNLLQQDLYPAGRNKVINGDFNVNQRAFTTTTTTATFGFDRWLLQTIDGTVTYSAQTFTAGTAPVVGYESTNFARIVSTGQTLTTANSILVQRIENVRTLANQTATVSFWAKAASGTPKVAVEFQQFFGTGGSSSVNTYGGQITLSTSWTRYSVTFSGASIVPSIDGNTLTGDSSLRLNLWTSAGTSFDSRTGSLGIQSATIDFWGVQVENGSTASPFQTASGSIGGELALCQRYYFRTSSSTTFGALASTAWAQSATLTEALVKLPVTMRAAPTTFDGSGVANLSFVNYAGSTFTLTGGATITTTQTTPDTVKLLCGSTGMTAGHVGNWAGNASGYISFGAEL